MMEVHVTTSQLGDLLGTIAHPHRLMLVLALSSGPRDAQELAKMIGLGSGGVIEHLRVLRAHHVVAEQREGARSVYTLTWPGMVDWLGVGASFIEGHLSPATGKLVELPKAGRS